MSNVIFISAQSRRRPIGFQSRAESPGRSTTKSKRALLFLVLLATTLLLAGCTDHLDITGLPATCKDQTGKDVAARVEVRITQAGNLVAVDTMTVNSKGEAEFMIGAVTQSKSLLKPGHRPANPPLNVIYTADPVSIELRFKDPCKFDTKTKTIVLDDLPHHKTRGRLRYTLAYANF
jgi:hypothetical protein